MSLPVQEGEQAPPSSADAHRASAAAGVAAAAAPPPPPAVDRAACAHTPSYCEENAYRLALRLAARGDGAAVHAVFVSNAQRQVPVFEQRAAPARFADGTKNQNSLCVWDYHVIVALFATPPASPPSSGESPPPPAAWVYDLDTRLEPFPCPAAAYCRAALPPPAAGAPRRRYRAVPAAALAAGFASDRRHMRAAGGAWLAPPPGEPCIRPAGGGAAHTLPLYLDMEDERGAGRAELPAAELRALVDGAPLGAALDEAAFFRWLGAGS